MRSAFFGTPALAVPALRALAALTDVRGVVCQPDRPAGRGLRQQPPPLKLAALELGLEVHQPIKVRTGTLDAWLKDRGVEVAVVLAYGRILPPAVLGAPPLGCLNLHASLLPKYRGAAPINWCLMNGETETGISLMQMEEDLDTGPVFSAHPISIGPRETAGDLCDRLSALAAQVIEQDLPRILDGSLRAVPQDHEQATWAPPIRREHCQIDWTWSADRIARRVRGLVPRPGAQTRIGGKCLRLLTVEAGQAHFDGPPGALHIVGRQRAFVACGQGSVEILEAQVEGRRVCKAPDMINGRVLTDGAELKDEP